MVYSLLYAVFISFNWYLYYVLENCKKHNLREYILLYNMSKVQCTPFLSGGTSDKKAAAFKWPAWQNRLVSFIQFLCTFSRWNKLYKVSREVCMRFCASVSSALYTLVTALIVIVWRTELLVTAHCHTSAISSQIIGRFMP